MVICIRMTQIPVNMRTYPIPHRFRRSRAFTFIDALMSAAMLSTVAAIGWLAFGGMKQGTEQMKLAQDTAMVNRAIRVFIASGGTLEPGMQPQDVLQRVKMSVAAGEGKYRTVLTGGMLDPRVKGEMTSGAGQKRAVWDGATQQFALRTTGTGVSKFVLDESAIPAPGDSADRRGSYEFARTSNWIWDHDAVAPVTRGLVTNTGTAAAVSRTPVDLPDAGVATLLPPVFSLDGGLRDPRAYRPALPLVLSDPNPAGTSWLFYSVGTGPWLRYTPEQTIRLPQELLTTVRAYTAAVDPENFSDSTMVEQDYETVWFSGEADGAFHTPAGPPGMVTNLPPGGEDDEFTWGVAAPGFPSPNRLNFDGKSFDRIAPGEEFELGTLTYFNGTTLAGTTAAEVQIRIPIDLSVPQSREVLNFTWALESTLNLPEQTEDQNADFVRMGELSARLQTTVAGRRYYLNLRFGENSPNGFATISTFHAHEGKTLRGKVYGTFSLDPADGEFMPEDEEEDEDGARGRASRGESVADR